MSAAFDEATDPFLWLEEVEGERALEQVRTWNAKTDALCRAHPDFLSYEARARAMMDDGRRIAMPEPLGEHIYNFWSDGDHLRGIWRRASQARYVAGDPDWEILLDIDALGRDEGANWVWHGAQLLRTAIAPSSPCRTAAVIR